MSELRERCKQVLYRLVDEIGYHEDGGFIEPNENECLAILKAFAKAEQIKGMEAVSSQMKKVAFLYGNDKWRQRMALTEMAEWIDAEIEKLKEGE